MFVKNYTGKILNVYVGYTPFVPILNKLKRTRRTNLDIEFKYPK